MCCLPWTSKAWGKDRLIFKDTESELTLAKSDNTLSEVKKNYWFLKLIANYVNDLYTLNHIFPYIISADNIEGCGVENVDFSIERGDEMVTFLLHVV